VSTAWKYWILTLALVVWWALAWLAGPWLNLQGQNLWILRGALALIGLAAFITFVWWFRGLDEHHALRLAEEGTAGSDEIDILLRKAQVRLRSTGAGKTGLSDLPAILILGEPGSAKTSIVHQSGLEPQLLAGNTVQNNLPVPTRALNLWLARPFVLVEAGGPLLQEPPRWAHLVENFSPALSRVVGKGPAPPRVALLCIDCEKLLTPGVIAATLGASLDQWRSRLREASHLLGINLPVYVLFTRSDRLQFFQDYVAPLSNDEASRVLGAALAITEFSPESYAEIETAVVSTAFDHLFQSLADSRPTLLARKFDTPQTPAIYEFPREFKKLRAIVTPILVEIFRPGHSRTNPFLRGFYFTGVRPVVVSTPRPAPATEKASAAVGDMNATRIFDVNKSAGQKDDAPGAEETRRVPQWVFLPQLFKEVLFQDSAALATSTFSTRIGQRKKILLVSAMGILMLLMASFTVSAVRNRRLEDQVTAAAAGVSSTNITGRQLPSMEALTRLDALRQAVDLLEVNERIGAPVTMRWGLYVGNSLLPDARRIYFQDFNELLFRPTQAALVQSLAALPASPGPNDRYDPAFDTLKTYLLTTSDTARGDREFLTPALMRAWVGGRDIDPPRAQLAERQFDFYAGELAASNPFPVAGDAQTVRHARGYLTQFPGDQHAYQLLLAEAERTNPSLSFNRKFPGAADVVTDQAEINGAFTKGGWGFVQSALQNPGPYFSAEAWVLGQKSPTLADLTKRADDLRRTYLQAYVAQWRSFLQSAKVVHPVSLDNASRELQALSNDQSPLLALFCVAAQNTTVHQPDVTGAFQTVQSLVPPDCQDQPAGPATSAYLKDLGDLQACVDRADRSPASQSESAKAQCLTVAAQAEDAVQKLAAGFPADPNGHTDETLKNLLQEPVDAVAALLRPGPVSAAGLCAQMSTLESLYPFNAQAPKEVSAQELAAVFAPSRGALSQFYSSALKTLLVPQAGWYAPSPAAPQKVTPEFLDFFNPAVDVQRALYPSGGDTLQFRYALRPVATENVTSLTLTIDGKTLNFTGGNSPFTSLSWPGTSGQGVRMAVRIPGGAEWGFPSYDGKWGVFRFFADAAVVRKNGNVHTLQWVLGGDHPITAPNGKQISVQFELDTLGARPILEKGILSNLRCVPVVAK